jgi:hypothetical protein
LLGEATTNTPAELDEIYAAHEGCLDSVGIDRPLDFLVNPLRQDPRMPDDFHQTNHCALGSLEKERTGETGLCLCFCAALYPEGRLAPTDRQIGSIEFRSVFGL